jgi:hypothetical protein
MKGGPGFNPYPRHQRAATLKNREPVTASGHWKRAEVVLMTVPAARPGRPAHIKPITPASSLRTG